MSLQEILITNVKTAQYNHVNMNKAFDPDVEHNQPFEFENCKISSPFTGGIMFLRK